MQDLIEGSADVIDDRYSRIVIGAAIQVHKRLGPGFLEAVYQRALRYELSAMKIGWAAEVEVPVLYRGMVVGRHRLDLVVGGELVVELKSTSRLEVIHFAQVRSYLAASGIRVGLLLNFDQTKLTIRRVVDQAYKDRLRGLGVSSQHHLATGSQESSSATP